MVQPQAEAMSIWVRWPFNTALPLALRHLTRGKEALEKIAWDLWEPPVLDFFKNLLENICQEQVAER